MIVSYAIIPNRCTSESTDRNVANVLDGRRILIASLILCSPTGKASDMGVRNSYPAEARFGHIPPGRISMSIQSFEIKLAYIYTASGEYKLTK